MQAETGIGEGRRVPRIILGSLLVVETCMISWFNVKKRCPRCCMRTKDYTDILENSLDQIRTPMMSDASPTSYSHDSDAQLVARPVTCIANSSDEPFPAFARAPIPSAHTAQWQATSLFSGCGGLDLGFLQQGIMSRGAYDINASALATYSANLPGAAFHADLSRFTPNGLCGEVLLAGAPCQGFSTAGKRRLEDPRNALLMRVADIALKGRPKVLLVENVPAAYSGSHRKLWTALEDRLRLAGYNVRRMLLGGETCGMAQRRRRLFLLCWLGSDCVRVGFDAQAPVQLKEVLRGVQFTTDHDPEWPEEGCRDWIVARKIKPGHKLSNVRLGDRAVATWDIPEIFGETSESERNVLKAVARLRRRQRIRNEGDGDPVHLDRIEIDCGRDVRKCVQRLVEVGYLRSVDDCYELRQTYNGRYRRLEWNSVSPTVDTRFGRIDLFIHPTEDRGMTYREAARIQGFPDSFGFIGTKSEKFSQIGNAVPPPMAAVLAQFLRDAILKA